MYLSIIIPTKNEPGIQDLIHEINRAVKVKKEIIVVDKSTVPPKVKGARVLRQQSDGLGNAFIEGFRKTKGNVIAIMDGDGSHDPEDLAKMLEKLPEYDMVLGSKFTPGGKTHYPYYRRMISRVFNTLTRIVLGMPLKDPMTGFAAVKREVIEKVDFRPREGFKILLEIAYKTRPKIYEQPITFRKRLAGESKVGINKSGVKEVFRILSLLIELRRGGHR